MIFLAAPGCWPCRRLLEAQLLLVGQGADRTAGALHDLDGLVLILLGQLILALCGLLDGLGQSLLLLGSQGVPLGLVHNHIVGGVHMLGQGAVGLDLLELVAGDDRPGGSPGRRRCRSAER